MTGNFSFHHALIFFSSYFYSLINLFPLFFGEITSLRIHYFTALGKSATINFNLIKIYWTGLSEVIAIFLAFDELLRKLLGKTILTAFENLLMNLVLI